ncbi:MAG: peptidoglycan synthetase, partial [Maribacter dokdonensis]
EAVIFFLPESVAIKKLEAVTAVQISEAFQRNDLKIFTDAKSFHDYLETQSYKDTTLLLMSSGNYGGFDLNKLHGLLS